MKIALAILFALTLGAAAQTAHPIAKPGDAKIAADLSSKSPTLSDSLKLKFFKAQSELIQASEAAKQSAQTAQQKQATFQGVVTELQTVCGAANQLELDKEGNPVCVVKAPGAEKSK